jgi:outer membrane lipoprotein-sorting protein
MSLFFLLLTALVVLSIRVMQSVKNVVERAGEVVDSVEDVAQTFVESQGKLTLFKLVRNIMKSANRRRK